MLGSKNNNSFGIHKLWQSLVSSLLNQLNSTNTILIGPSTITINGATA